VRNSKKMLKRKRKAILWDKNLEEQRDGGLAVPRGNYNSTSTARRLP